MMLIRPLFALLIVMLSAFAVACGDDDGDTDPTPTADVASPTAAGGDGTPTPAAAASPTASAGGEQAGPEGFRAFVAELDAAVRAGDTEFMLDRLQTERVVCGEEDVPPGLGGPACEFVGQEFDGFTVASWRSEGSVVPVETVHERFGDGYFAGALPGESDEFTDGEPQVYAINATEERYAALLTAIIERPPDFAGEGPLRVALDTEWEFDGERWRMTWLMGAYVLAEEFLRPDEVVESYYPAWERWGV